jgi:hypothetical protein
VSKVDLRLQCGMPCSKLEVSTVQHGTLSGAGYLHQSLLAYVEQALVPELRPGDVVIMDNLPAHKVAGVRQAIETAGQASNTSRPTVPTSIPSKWPSQNSNPSCEPQPRELFQTSGRPSPTPCAASHLKNAQTISPPQDTMQPERKML